MTAKLRISSDATVRSLGLILLATVIWLASLQQVDLDALTDIGLISALPATTFIAFALLSASFFFTLRQTPLRVPILLLHVAVLIVLLYGIAAVVEPFPRFAEGWRNVGYADVILRTGQIYPEEEVYFSWPGFFILVALLVDVAGLPNALSFAAWSPVFFNLLYIGPLVLIFGALTHDKRHIWLAVWFFFLANWIGQDYLAPQALSYFFFLVVVGILLRAFRTSGYSPNAITSRAAAVGSRFLPSRTVRWIRSLSVDTATDPPLSPGLRLAILSVIAALFLGIIVIQPVTPIFLLFALLALILAQRTHLVGLPLLLVVMTVTWWVVAAQPFLAYNAPIVYDELGQLGSITDRNVADRLQGSPGHVFVTRLRVLFTLTIWLLAGLGLVRRLRQKQLDLTSAALFVAPFPFLALLSYGGEMIHRVYLFGLAPAVFLAAALFYPRPAAGSSWLTTCMLTILSVVLIAGFLTARHGNERMDSFTAGGVEAVNYMYDVAPPGSLLLAATQSTPWQHRDVEKHDHLFLANSDDPTVSEAIADADDYDEVLAVIEDLMSDEEYTEAYLIITESQIAHSELFGYFPPDGAAGLENALIESGNFDIVYRNDSATVFTLEKP